MELIRVDESQIRGHLDTVVKASVEETLNKLLDAEANDLCKADRYERSPNRLDTRAGSYQRKLYTAAGEVNLKVPRLRSLPFETPIIERYKRREASEEESLVLMYLAGVSVRRVKEITEALWGMSEAGLVEFLSYISFPREHWIRIRTNNALERLNLEIRRRIRVIGNFPDGPSAPILVAARLRNVAGKRLGARWYLDMDVFEYQNQRKVR